MFAPFTGDSDLAFCEVPAGPEAAAEAVFAYDRGCACTVSEGLAAAVEALGVVAFNESCACCEAALVIRESAEVGGQMMDRSFFGRITHDGRRRSGLGASEGGGERSRGRTWKAS